MDTNFKFAYMSLVIEQTMSDLDLDTVCSSDVRFLINSQDLDRVRQDKLNDRFSLYSDKSESTTVDILFHISLEEPLIARVEESGSEGFYVEIARWSDKSESWCAYAYNKYFDKKEAQFVARLLDKGIETEPLISKLSKFHEK